MKPQTVHFLNLWVNEAWAGFVAVLILCLLIFTGRTAYLVAMTSTVTLAPWSAWSQIKRLSRNFDEP